MIPHRSAQPYDPIKQRREAALDAAKRATDKIERRRHEIEAERLNYTARPHLPQTPYRWMIEGKPIPDKWAEKVRAWQQADLSRLEAHRQADLLEHVLEADINALERYKSLSEALIALTKPIRGQNVPKTAYDATAAAFMVHDPALNFREVVKVVDPEINANDVREVQAAMMDKPRTYFGIMDQFYRNNATTDTRRSLMHGFFELKKGFPRTWDNTEEVIKRIFGDKNGSTVVRGLEAMVNFIREPAPALPEPAATISTTSKEPEPDPPKPAPYSGPSGP